MQDVTELGGCPGKDKFCLGIGGTPIIVDRRIQIKAFTSCPMCGGDLQISSGGYECRNCGEICFPVYNHRKGSGPVKISPIIDADKVQETARIERLLAQGKRYQQTGDVRSFTTAPIIDGYYHNYLENEFERGHRK